LKRAEVSILLELLSLLLVESPTARGRSIHNFRWCCRFYFRIKSYTNWAFHVKRRST